MGECLWKLVEAVYVKANLKNIEVSMTEKQFAYKSGGGTSAAIKNLMSILSQNKEKGK